MTLVSFFSRLAAFALATFVASVACNVATLACFALAVGALFLLVVAGDYAPASARRPERAGAILAFSAPGASAAVSPEKIAA